MQLGQAGKISQIFKDNGNNMNCVLTFTLAPEGVDCQNNSIAANVLAPGRSKVFLLERRYGRKMWETHAYSLGNLANEKQFINLEIPWDTDTRVTCWPVVDTFIIKVLGGISIQVSLLLRMHTYIDENNSY